MKSIDRSCKHSATNISNINYGLVISNTEGVVGWCDGAGQTSSAGGVLLIWIREGQGPSVLAVSAGGVV